jgi:5'-deoxynucleotidase YfbR-like HD superfamily hydrolase
VDDTEVVTCDKELANLLARSRPARPISGTEKRKDEARSALVEKVAEKETLVALLSVIEVATSRKARLLKLMDKFNCLLVDRLPYGAGAPSNHVISDYFEGHYAWLEANLKATNHSLDRAIAYLKVMYAGAYSST